MISRVSWAAAWFGFTAYLFCDLMADGHGGRWAAVVGISVASLIDSIREGHKSGYSAPTGDK